MLQTAQQSAVWAAKRASQVTHGAATTDQKAARKGQELQQTHLNNTEVTVRIATQHQDCHSVRAQFSHCTRNSEDCCICFFADGTEAAHLSELSSILHCGQQAMILATTIKKKKKSSYFSCHLLLAHKSSASFESDLYLDSGENEPVDPSQRSGRM